MRNFTWNRFPVKNLLIDSLLAPIVESTYLNRDMCKFESSKKDESRWQSTDSSKAYRNTSVFKCASTYDMWLLVSFTFVQILFAMRLCIFFISFVSYIICLQKIYMSVRPRKWNLTSNLAKHQVHAITKWRCISQDKRLIASSFSTDAVRWAIGKNIVKKW